MNPDYFTIRVTGKRHIMIIKKEIGYSGYSLLQYFLKKDDRESGWHEGASKEFILNNGSWSKVY